MMGGAVKLRRANALPFQKLNEEVLVVNPKTREVHLLNPTATRIWELLENENTAAELIASLTAEYDADRAQVGEDVDALLAELAAKGLIATDKNDGKNDNKTDRSTTDSKRSSPRGR